MRKFVLYVSISFAVAMLFVTTTPAQTELGELVRIAQEEIEDIEHILSSLREAQRISGWDRFSESSLRIGVVSFVGLNFLLPPYFILPPLYELGSSTIGEEVTAVTSFWLIFFLVRWAGRPLENLFRLPFMQRSSLIVTEAVEPSLSSRRDKADYFENQFAQAYVKGRHTSVDDILAIHEFVKDLCAKLVEEEPHFSALTMRQLTGRMLRVADARSRIIFLEAALRIWVAYKEFLQDQVRIRVQMTRGPCSDSLRRTSLEPGFESKH